MASESETKVADSVDKSRPNPVPRFRTGSALALTVARGVSLLGFLIATAILSRVLDRNDYAVFRQCWTLSLTTAPLLAIALSQSLFYFVGRRGGTGDRRLVGRTLMVATAGSTVTGVALILGARPIANAFSNSSAWQSFAVFSIFLMSSIPLQLSDGIFMTVNRSGHAALFNVLNRLTVLLALAIPIWLFALPLTQGLAVLGIAQGLVFAVLVWRALAVHTVTDHDAIVPWGEHIRYAIPLVAASALGALFLQLDKYIVSAFSSPSEFAIYSNGAFENPIVALVTAASSATVAGQLARLREVKDDQGFIRLWGAMTAKVALAIIPMAAFMFAFAPEIVVALFSERYLESAGVFRLYVLLTPVRIIAFATLFMALNRNYIYLAGHVLACALIVVGGPVMFKAVGFTGPVIALLLASYLTAIAFLTVAAKALHVRFWAVLPFRWLASITVISGAAAAGAYALNDLVIHASGLSALVVGGMTFAVLGGGALAFARPRTSS